MNMKPGLRLLGVIAATIFIAISAQAQDFHKTYPAASGSHLRIGNISGDVRVTGYNGDVIIVDAVKTGVDKDLVKIEDLSTPERIDLKVSYPEQGNSHAAVNFSVKVPQNLDLNFDQIGSVSGNVVINSVRGRMKAGSVSGNVTMINVTGMVSAQSVSGNVEVEFVQLEGSGEMKFASVSGNVAVKAPANLDADVEISSVSGSLKCDFPIEIQERRYGPGRSGKGRLGSGLNHLRINSVSGRVSLIRI